MAPKKIPRLPNQQEEEYAPNVAVNNIAPGHHASVFPNFARHPTANNMVALACGAEIRLLEDYAPKPPTLQHVLKDVKHFSLSPDGKMMATTNGDCSGTIQWWSTEGDELRLLHTEDNAHRSAVCTLAFSPDGKTLVSGAMSFRDDNITIWLVADYKLLRTVKNGDCIAALVFNPDGSTFVSAGYRTIKIWTTGGMPVRTLSSVWTPHHCSVVFSPDGKTLVSCSWGIDQIKIWSAHDGKLLRTVDDAHERGVGSLAFSPDGMTFASCGNYDRLIKMWHVEGGELLRTIRLKANIHSLAFSPDGQTLVSCGHRHIKMWSAENGELLHTVVNNDFIDTLHSSLVFTTDGTTLFAPLAGGGQKIWSLMDGKVQRTMSHRHGTVVRQLAFSPDGMTLASVDLDGNTKIWSVEDGKLLYTINNALGNAINSFAFSPDSNRFAVRDSEGILKVWDTTTWLPCAVVVTVEASQVAPARDAIVFPAAGKQLALRTVTHHDAAIPQDENKAPVDFLQILQKTSTLRAFLAKYHTPTQALLFLWPTVKQAQEDWPLQCAIAEQRSIIDDARSSLELTTFQDAVQRIDNGLDALCRAALVDDALINAVDATMDVVRQSVMVLKNLRQETPQLPPFQQVVYDDELLPWTVAALSAGRKALAQFDDPKTHVSPACAKAATEAVLSAHQHLLGGQLKERGDAALPVKDIEALHAQVAHDANTVATVAYDLLGQLYSFKDAAGAFGEVCRTFAGTVGDGEAKCNELRAMQDELHDLQADRRVQVAELTRRGLSDARRTEIDNKIHTISNDISTLRSEYRRKYRLASDTIITRFFPELREKIRDSTNSSFSAISIFDSSLTLDDFANQQRHNGNITNATFQGKPVVLKHFSQNQLAAFERECKVYSTVKGAYVGELKSAFADGGGFTTVMPQYPGGAADEWVSRHADKPELVVKVLHQVAEGLKLLHSSGVVHCDLKPQNIVMTSVGPLGVAKIIDFDCADIKDTATVFLARTTQTLHSLNGFTPAYVAPEVTQLLSQTSTVVTTASLTELVRPALDIFALGRWASEVLGAPSTSTAAFKLPPVDEGVLLDATISALQLFQDELEALINRMLSADPAARPSAAEVAETLSFISLQLSAATANEYIEKCEAIECSVCGKEVKRGDTVTCTSAHTYCSNPCLGNMLKHWRNDRPVAKHMDAQSRVLCSYGNCDAEISVESICELITDGSATEDISYVRVKVAEFTAIEELKERYKNESLLQRAIRHVDEEILALRCPNCKTTSAIDFKACLAMQCIRCRAHFCGYCEEPCGNMNIAHTHVLDNHGGDAGLGLFTTQEVYTRFWHTRHRDALDKYLTTLPDDIAEAVRKHILPPLPAAEAA